MEKNKDRISLLRVLWETHKAIKSYAGALGVDLPTATKILIDVGLRNVNREESKPS